MKQIEGGKTELAELVKTKPVTQIVRLMKSGTEKNERPIGKVYRNGASIKLATQDPTLILFRDVRPKSS